MSVAEFPATYIYEKVDISYELDDEKSCAKPATKIHKVEDLKTAIILKLNNILGKMRETACPVTKVKQYFGKNERNSLPSYGKISHYYKSITQDFFNYICYGKTKISESSVIRVTKRNI